MKRIKIGLTEWQADEIIHALELDINGEYGMSDPANQRIQRIINKIEKAKEESND